eukprot:gene17197-biopygen9843
MLPAQGWMHTGFTGGGGRPREKRQRTRTGRGPGAGRKNFVLEVRFGNWPGLHMYESKIPKWNKHKWYGIETWGKRNLGGQNEKLGGRGPDVDRTRAWPFLPGGGQGVHADY